VVFDPLAGAATVRAIQLLQPRGRLALFGASLSPTADVDLRQLYRKSVQLLTYSGTIEPHDRQRTACATIMDLLAQGKLRVPIDDVLPLESAANAHRRIRERAVTGKLILRTGAI
jgi:NADPH2:quinone reductase